MVSDELYGLEKDGFGALLNKQKHAKIRKEIFAKPHPDTLAQNDAVLASAMMSLEGYSEKFNKCNDIPTQAAEVLRNHHPHRDMMENILTQTQSSDEFSQ